MDLQQLQQRTGVSLRKLRYCVDHDLIAGLPIEFTPGKRGRPRRFAEEVGFGIVCAAHLVDSGLAHEKIRWFLGGLSGIAVGRPGQQKSALAAVLERPAGAIAYLGDWINVRIKVEEYDYDSGWIAPGNPAELDAGYEPTISIVLNLGKLRDQVFARNSNNPNNSKASP